MRSFVIASCLALSGFAHAATTPIAVLRKQINAGTQVKIQPSMSANSQYQVLLGALGVRPRMTRHGVLARGTSTRATTTFDIFKVTPPPTLVPLTAYITKQTAYGPSFSKVALDSN